jgi:hypothetical protein
MGRSFTTYARVMVGSGTAVWEIRAHATMAEQQGGAGGNAVFGLGGAGTGTLVPSQQGQGQGVGAAGADGGAGLAGKAVWVMGRKVADPAGEDNAQS